MSPASKAQQRAVNKYMSENYDRINLTTPKGKKDEIKAHADSHGESVNSFINRAIDETIARDNAVADGRELAIELINQLPEYKIGYAITYLQGLSADDNAGASAEEQEK